MYLLVVATQPYTINSYSHGYSSHIHICDVPDNSHHHLCHQRLGIQLVWLISARQSELGLFLLCGAVFEMEKASALLTGVSTT